MTLRSPDLAIFVSTNRRTDRENYIPLAHARGVSLQPTNDAKTWTAKLFQRNPHNEYNPNAISNLTTQHLRHTRS